MELYDFRLLSHNKTCQTANRKSQHKAGSGKKKPRRFATGHTRPDDKALTLYPLIRDYPDSDNTHLRGSSSRKKGELVARWILLYIALSN